MKCFALVIFCLFVMTSQVQAAILIESANGSLVPGPSNMAAACAQTMPIHITSVLNTTMSNMSSASGATCNAPINIHPGGGISNTTTFRLTTFTAGLYKVFYGSGAITGLQVAYPEWFASNAAPGTTDMATAANQAAAAAPHLKFGPTSYKFTSPLNITCSQSVIGIPGQTKFILSNTDGISATGGSYKLIGEIHGITFDGGNTSPPVTGGYYAIKVWDGGTSNISNQALNMHITDCAVYNIMSGFYLRTAWQTVMERNVMNNVPLGIQVLGLSVNTKSQNNILNQYDGVNISKAGSIGFNIQSYNYSTGGVQQPQDVTTEGDQVYTYETGIYEGLGILVRIFHDMIDVCSLYGIAYQSDDNLIIENNWIGVTGPTTATVYGIYAVNTGSDNTNKDVGVQIRGNNIFENTGSLSTASTGYRARQFNNGTVVDSNTLHGFKTQDLDLSNITYPIRLYKNRFNSTVPTNSVQMSTIVGGYIISDGNYSATIPYYLNPSYNTSNLNMIGRDIGVTQSTYAKGTATITSGNTTVNITVPMGSNSGIYPLLKINNIVSTTTNPILTNSVVYNANSSIITITSTASAPVGGIKIYWEAQGIWYGDI
jgi:hypothetical protein